MTQIKKITKNNITEICNMIENAILKTAEKYFRKNKQALITNDILDLCDGIRKLKEATK